MRKSAEMKLEAQKGIMRQKQNLDLEHRRGALRPLVEDINKQLKHEADEMKLAKMMDRVAVQAQAQIARNKKSHQKSHKIARKKRNSDSDFSDKQSSPDSEAPKSLEDVAFSKDESYEPEFMYPAPGIQFQKRR